MRWMLAVCVGCLVLAGLAPHAVADDAAPTRLIREGYSGPVTAPTVTPGRVYRAGRTPMGPPVEKDWRVVIAGYTWASSISGTAYDDGVESDIDVPFSDIVDILDYALFGYFEVGYRRWSFAIDTSFIGLEKSLPQRGPFLPDFKLDQTILDLRFGYTLYCRNLGFDGWKCCLYPRRLTLDAIAGVRYWNVKQTLEVRSAAAPTVDRVSRESWWDPYVGARLRWPFAKRWGASLYGDIGGFGIGAASDLTWEVQALLTFNITRQLYAGLGYRALYVDRVQGSGNAREGQKSTTHGPILGLGFKF